MKIGGFQPTSLLDYPDTISAIIWTAGCNFRCPFCYNRDLVLEKSKLFPEEDVLTFLKKRKGMLEALVVTGGEPLLQEDLPQFLEKVKKLGYLVKVDTNGSYPDRLNELIEKKLVDYIAMDVKAPREKYDTLTGVKTDIEKITKSIELIKNSNLDYEFRTTFVPTLLTKEDIIEIGKWLENSKRYCIQQFKNDTPLISSDLQKFIPYQREILIEVCEKVKHLFKECYVRGV